MGLAEEAGPRGGKNRSIRAGKKRMTCPARGEKEMTGDGSSRKASSGSEERDLRAVRVRAGVGR